MSRILIVFALLCASLSILAGGSYGASPNDEHQGANDSSAQPVNPVVQWNRTLLTIVRTPGAQPPTVHPTRSFATMHAALYDAVNAIDRTHRPYLVRLSGYHEMLRRKRQQPRQRIKFWLCCIRGSRPRSMPYYSNPWQKFRMATTRPKVSV
jgi:hypothetical protein